MWDDASAREKSNIAVKEGSIEPRHIDSLEGNGLRSHELRLE